MPYAFVKLPVPDGRTRARWEQAGTFDSRRETPARGESSYNPADVWGGVNRPRECGDKRRNSWS